MRERISVGKAGLHRLRFPQRGTVQQRNLIMAGCVLLCCLHPGVILTNIRRAGQRAWPSDKRLENKDKAVCARLCVHVAV